MYDYDDGGLAFACVFVIANSLASHRIALH